MVYGFGTVAVTKKQVEEMEVAKMRMLRFAKEVMRKDKFRNLFYLFIYFYIYPPDSQESDGGVIHRASNYPNLLPDMPRYCCLLEILIKV